MIIFSIYQLHIIFKLLMLHHPFRTFQRETGSDVIVCQKNSKVFRGFSQKLAIKNNSFLHKCVWINLLQDLNGFPGQIKVSVKSYLYYQRRLVLPTNMYRVQYIGDTSEGNLSILANVLNPETQKIRTLNLFSLHRQF